MGEGQDITIVPCQILVRAGGRQDPAAGDELPAVEEPAEVGLPFGLGGRAFHGGQAAGDAGLIATELAIAQANVYRLLRPLLDGGIVVESTSQARHRVWRAPEVLAALDAFAVRAGRRTLPNSG